VIKYHVEQALRERDFAYLTDLIRNNAEMSPETREYLADILLGLLTGKTKFPKHRPKKKATHDKNRAIAERVLKLGYEGWSKRTAAVRQTAAEFHCSVTTVWNCLKEERTERAFKEAWCEDKHLFDAMIDLAHEATMEAAAELLRKETGVDREFSDEEKARFNHACEASLVESSACNGI
jgi:hypothetical protein